MAVALGYAAILSDPRVIGLLLEGSGKAVALGTGLFLAAVPLLSLPRIFKVRNELEEILAATLSTRDILALNAIVSMSEELLFRGVLLRLIGVVPSSVVFGAIHYVGYRSLTEVVYALCTGLVLGYLYKHFFPNILFPITFHFLANAFSLLLTKRQSLWSRNGFKRSE